MQNTPYMGLVQWNDDGDDFSSAQLSTNFGLIDSHNHTQGQGTQIPSAGIQTNAITSTLIAPGAVGTTELATNAVTTNTIANGSVTNAKIAAGAVNASSVLANSLTYTQLDPNVVPLGTVALWWRPAGSNLTPGGNWEIMDGRAWNTITNGWGLSSGTIPDMRGVFPFGADINASVAPGIGGTGGSNSLSLAHSHNVNAHQHSVPSHAHIIGNDGSHSHTFENGQALALRQNTFASGLTFKDTSGINRNNQYNTLVIGDIQLEVGEVDYMSMDFAGTHNHSGATGQISLVTNTATSTTDTQLGTVSLTPAYTALLFIMRCR